MQSNAETADRMTKRRARILIVSATLFLTLQAVYFVQAGGDTGRLVDQVRISAWLAWAAVLLLLLATGGGFLRSREVRALMNDEGTRANRAEAFRFGFWAAMATAVVIYFLTMYETVTGREATHLILTAGVGVALLRFGMLERRASRDG